MESLKSFTLGHGRQFRYFINLMSLTQGDKKNRTPETLLFTVSNSWPVRIRFEA